MTDALFLFLVFLVAVFVLSLFAYNDIREAKIQEIARKKEWNDLMKALFPGSPPVFPEVVEDEL
jgi:CBS domain containing-hemolysin-like protein